MHRIILRLSAAILCFIIGITSSFIWLAFYNVTLHEAERSFSLNLFPELNLISNGQDIKGSVELNQCRNLKRTHRPFSDGQEKIAPVQISSSRLLVTVGDTLYLLGLKCQVLWKWDTGDGEDIMDEPFIDSQGNIFGIADDGIIFSLALDGKVRWRHRMMCSYGFTQLKPYQKDQFLVVVDASSYRELRHFDEDDVLYLYKDEEVVGQAGFYRNAVLEVRGKRIFAVIKGKGKVRRKEIKFTKVNDTN